jgi:hypothetical protein
LDPSINDPNGSLTFGPKLGADVQQLVSTGGTRLALPRCSKWPSTALARAGRSERWCFAEALRDLQSIRGEGSPLTSGEGRERLFTVLCLAGAGAHLIVIGIQTVLHAMHAGALAVRLPMDVVLRR